MAGGGAEDEEMEEYVDVTNATLDQMSRSSSSSGWISNNDLLTAPWSELLVKYAEHEILTEEMGVKITFPNGEIVPILTQIVASKCPYFRQLFSDNREVIRQELQRNLLQISPSVFKTFLLVRFKMIVNIINLFISLV